MKKILKTLCCIILMATSCQNENSIDEISEQNILVYKYYTPKYDLETNPATPIDFTHTGEIDSIFEMGSVEFNNEVYHKTFIKKTNRNGITTSKYEYK